MIKLRARVVKFVQWYLYDSDEKKIVMSTGDRLIVMIPAWFVLTFMNLFRLFIAVPIAMMVWIVIRVIIDFTEILSGIYDMLSLAIKNTFESMTNDCRVVSKVCNNDHSEKLIKPKIPG